MINLIGSDLESYYRNATVAAWQGAMVYSQTPPYHPQTRYPEYNLNLTEEESNPAYEGVRACFQMLGLDVENFGTPQWNPLREVIHPGDQVVIKPNFVLSRHVQGGNLFAIITHPSVLRAIIDYAYKALGRDGQIIIADAPQMDCNFQELLNATCLASIQELYWDHYRFPIQILDFRDFWLDVNLEEKIASVEKRFPLPGDPQGNILVNLGQKSAFSNRHHLDRIYGADYNRQETIAHHHGSVHEYYISRTILGADALISVPKMKVHKKVGVTLNAKGLVGITTNKNLLVHYTLGTPDQGGDQFPAHTLSKREKIIIQSQRFLYDALLARQDPALERVYNSIVKCYHSLVKPWFGGISTEKRLLDGGNWHGNDSAWRMAVDLMYIAFFADKEGELKETPQRKIFSVVDGIIGGENNGPLVPDAKAAGVILAGFNPLAVDIVGTRLMGFDWKKIKWITNMLNEQFYTSITDIRIISPNEAFLSSLNSNDQLLRFLPHPGWQGFIEITKSEG
jgi:uncharacterized protein (DUF362 family)